MKDNYFLLSTLIVGVVAVVAIVSLFLWSGGIEGAPTYWHTEEDQGGCLDTDPKNDFYTAGNVTKAFTRYEDYCLNGKTLFQHYCDWDYVRIVPYSCPNGCLNGVCIK